MELIVLSFFVLVGLIAVWISINSPFKPTRKKLALTFRVGFTEQYREIRFNDDHCFATARALCNHCIRHSPEELSRANEAQYFEHGCRIYHYQVQLKGSLYSLEPPVWTCEGCHDTLQEYLRMHLAPDMMPYIRQLFIAELDRIVLSYYGRFEPIPLRRVCRDCYSYH